MSPAIAAPPPPARIAWTRSRPLQGRALSPNQRSSQSAYSSPCGPAVPGPSAPCRLGGRGRRRRSPPVVPTAPNASATPCTRRRPSHCRRRLRSPFAAPRDCLSSGMPRTANVRAFRSGASPAAEPLPALSSPRHGDGQDTCADSRHGRCPSLFATGPTVAALPPQVRIAAIRRSLPRGGAQVTRQRPPQTGVS